MYKSVSDIPVGDSVSMTKTIGESDIYLFAGITGDFSRNHVDEEFMKTTEFGGRIAHGCMLVGLMGAASAIWGNQMALPSCSYGYEQVRFTKPVRIGDTIKVTYTIDRVDAEDMKSYANARCYNQRGELVALATHIVKFFAD